MSIEKWWTEKALSGVTGWLYKQRTEKQPARSRSWRWLPGMLIAGVAFIAAAVLAYKAWRRDKEIARLKHARDVNKQEELIKVEAMKVTAYQKRAFELQREAQAARFRINAIDSQLEEVQREYNEQSAKIQAIKNWRDVDRLLSQHTGASGSTGDAPSSG